MRGRYTSSIWRWIPDAPGKDQTEPSREALVDRARREAIGETRDLTGRLMGDPGAGRSALEKKIQAELRRSLGQTPVELEAEDEEQGDD